MLQLLHPAQGRLQVNVTIVTPYTQGRLRVNDVPAVWKVITHIHCPTVNSLFLSFSLSLPGSV